MATKTSSSKTAQRLSKEEKKAKNWIELGFKPHEDSWAKTAKRLIDAYNGKYFSRPSRRNRMTVNSIFSLVNLLLPNLIFTQPWIRANPRNAKYFKKRADGEYLQIDNIAAARVREASLNYKYTQLGGLIEQRKALQDALFYGFGITKQGYSFETISKDDKDYIVKDSPFMKRVDPKDFGWHPLATDLDDSLFFVHRVLTTKAKLKEQDRYDNIDELVPEIPAHIKERVKKPELLKEEGFITLYEVHDQEQDKIYTFGGENKVLLAKESNPYHFSGSHFSMIKLAGDNDTFEGVPLLAMVEDEARALNEVMTLIVEHMRKYPAILVYEAGAIDSDDVERIKNNEQGAMHQVANIEKVRFQNPLAMGGEYFSIISMLQGMIDRILGIPDFQRATSSTRKSATEATFIQGDATVRREYYLQLVKSFMLNGIGKLGALQAQFQDEEEEIQASGELRGMVFKYTKEDLQGDFQFDFDIEVLKPSNEAQLNNINVLLQTMASNPILHPFIRSKDPMKLGNYMFKKAGIPAETFDNEEAGLSLFVTPQTENKIARKGDPMPQPKPGEDHAYHIQIHKTDMEQNGPNEQILEHIATTMILQQREQAEQNPVAPQATPQAPGDILTQPEAVEPEGPTGPLQTPEGL